MQVGIKPSLDRSLGFHEGEVSRSRGSLMGKAQPRAGRARDERSLRGEVTGTMSHKVGLEPARACSGPSVQARLYYSACRSMLRAEHYVHSAQNAHGMLLVGRQHRVQAMSSYK